MCGPPVAAKKRGRLAWRGSRVSVPAASTIAPLIYLGGEE